MSKHGVTRATKNLVVKRSVSTLGHGRQFGFEEMMKCWRERVFRARVIGKERVELFYLPKEAFLNQLNEKDTLNYEKICDAYTDLNKDGKNLVDEMNGKSKKLGDFLDGAKLN